ncbi:MAG: chloride channel protein [Motiliproteus sp.]
MRMNSLSLNHFRLRLGDVDALPQWVLIGLLSGLLTGLIMLAFHHAINWPLQQLLPDGNPANFEGLPPEARLLLPIAGSLLLGLLLWRFSGSSQVGIAHVLERLSYHQGRMRLSNLLVQFVAATISLISGHSGGREGPAVHMGAGASSLIGQYLRLPNNSLRTLIGCGTAAAIAAAFDTPIAGIIFAMEVVMMEYTVAGFIPVMIAAITSNLVLRVSLGQHASDVIPALQMQTLHEIPFIVLLGFVIGLLAVLFSKLLTRTARWQKPPLFIRLQIAGVITGVAALFLPQIMGIGYDTVSNALSGQGSFELLAMLALVKLVVTALAIGLGVPVGIIGPTLFIGATAGAAIGALGISVVDLPVSEQGFYAMLGMGAMMAATLQAPLAALLALLELTLNANIILPAALTIITATLTYRFFFHQGSAFQALLVNRGLDWRRAPLERFLERTAAVSLMQPVSITTPRHVDRVHAQSLADNDQEWLLITQDNQPRAIIARSDLTIYLETLRDDSAQPVPNDNFTPSEPALSKQAPAEALIDLMSIPALRHDLTRVSAQATLSEALQQLNTDNCDALWLADHQDQPLGLLLRATITHHFSHEKSN